MKTSFKIGEISGIPIRLHLTLLIVVGYIAWSIGSNVFELAELLRIDPSAISPGFQSYIVGAIIAVGLFLSVLVHELAHSFMARSKGVEIEEISLWIFGGMASMSEIPHDPDTEIRISAVGPLTSLGIGAACFSVGILSPSIVSFVLKYLAFVNVLLAGFNSIPAFPMDGGRVLRAFFAKRESYISATDKAASIGKVFAVIFGIVGILVFNIFFILIAIFIYIGAGQESQNMKVKETLRSVKAEDIMSSEVKTVSPEMTLREFVDRGLEVQHTGFPVTREGEVVGIITLGDVKEISQEKYLELKVKDVMEKDVVYFSPEDSASEVWQEMASKDVGRFPIISDGQLVGVVTRSDIVRAFRRLSEIEAA